MYVTPSSFLLLLLLLRFPSRGEAFGSRGGERDPTSPVLYGIETEGGAGEGGEGKEETSTEARRAREFRPGPGHGFVGTLKILFRRFASSPDDCVSLHPAAGASCPCSSTSSCTPSPGIRSARKEIPPPDVPRAAKCARAFQFSRGILRRTPSV